MEKRNNKNFFLVQIGVVIMAIVGYFYIIEETQIEARESTFVERNSEIDAKLAERKSETTNSSEVNLAVELKDEILGTLDVLGMKEIAETEETKETEKIEEVQQFRLIQETEETVEDEEPDFIAFGKEANDFLVQENFTMPLILQNDPKWADKTYGTGEDENTMAINGCAIVSLAMILSYWQEETVTPLEILDWAGNDYFVTGQGTSWQIFEDFAHEYGLNYYGLSSYYEAKEVVKSGKPVVVSVRPGTFTEVGHIMVLEMNDQGEVVVFDPNDDPEKNHYQVEFDDEVFIDESLAFWSYDRG